MDSNTGAIEKQGHFELRDSNVISSNCWNLLKAVHHNVARKGEREGLKTNC